MRKSLWIILAVLCVAIGAPNAQADTFTATLTCDPSITCSSLPTASDVSFPAQTSIDVTVFETTVTLFLLLPDQFSDSYLWEAGIVEDLFVVVHIEDATDSQLITCDFDSCIPGGAPLDPSLTTDFEFGTLAFAPVATPEPATLLLLGTGLLGLAPLLRKRFAHLRHP